MKNQVIYIGGKKVADINGIFPRGFFYGDGVFETMRWRGFRPVFLEKHIKRILHGAAVLEIPISDGGEITGEIIKSAENSGFPDCVVKICLVSGGLPAPFFAKPDSFQIIISVTEFSDNFSVKPLKIIFLQNGYSRRYSPLSGIKSLNYLENILSMREAEKRGFDDALLPDADAAPVETTCRNIFFGHGTDIFTPPPDCGILPGITREILIDIASKAGFSVSELSLQEREIARMEFVFATNSVSGIVPVENIQFQDLTLDFSTSVHTSYLCLKNLLYQAFMWY